MIGSISPPLEISPDYTTYPDSTGISSKASPGYEFRLFYTYPFLFNTLLSVTGCLLYGISTYKIHFYKTESFNKLGWDNMDLFLMDDLINYYGFSIGLRYTILRKAKNDLSFTANLSGIYFPSGIGSFSIDANLGGNNYKNLFKSTMIINEKNSLRLVPELGLVFSQKIGKRISIEASIRGAWSKGYIMRTNPVYKIYGDKDTLTGSYQKKFRYIGVGLGASYVINKRYN